eukprot:56397_1
MKYYMDFADDMNSDFMCIAIKDICLRMLPANKVTNAIGTRSTLTKRQKKKIHEISNMLDAVSSFQAEIIKSYEDRLANQKIKKQKLETEYHNALKQTDAKSAARERAILRADIDAVTREVNRMTNEKHAIVKKCGQYLRQTHLKRIRKFADLCNKGGSGRRQVLTIYAQKFLLRCLTSYNFDTEKRR